MISVFRELLLTSVKRTTTLLSLLFEKHLILLLDVKVPMMDLQVYKSVDLNNNNRDYRYTITRISTTCQHLAKNRLYYYYKYLDLHLHFKLQDLLRM